MHKSMDLGYYIPEISTNYYPSLMSPLSTFSNFKSPSKPKNIFERLQADTELRLRARVNSVSASKTIKIKPDLPIEDKLINKGKEREMKLRHLVEKEELRKAEEMQDRPYVSPNSKAILREKSKNTMRTEKPAGKSEVFRQTPENTQRIEEISKTPLKKCDSSLRSYQKQLIKQLEVHYKLLCEKKKKPKTDPLEVRCVDRKYIPSFGKNKWKGLLPKSNSLNNSGAFQMTKGSLLRKKIRPDERNTTSSAIGFSQALTYQQIIRDRVVNFSESLRSLKHQK